MGKLWWVVEVVGYIVIAVLCRWLAGMHDKMGSNFAKFDIRKAECRFESDRHVVLRNVEAFMKHKGEAHESATLDQAIAAFNTVVHERVPALMARSLGTIGIPYRMTIMVDMPGICQIFQVFHKAFWTGDELTAQVAEFILTFSHFLLVGPLVLASGVCVAKAFSQRTGVAWTSLALTSIFATLLLSETMLSVPLIALAFVAQHYPIAAAAGLAFYCYLLLLWLFLAYGFPDILIRWWRKFEDDGDRKDDARKGVDTEESESDTDDCEKMC
jgi:hypothetical protein